MKKGEEFLIWNGVVQPTRELAINPLSEGWLYGVGCFETMKWESGTLRFLPDHWSRLTKTTAEIGWKLPLTCSELKKFAGTLADKNGCRTGIARLSLHLDGTKVDWMLRIFPQARIPSPGLRVAPSRFSHPGASPISGWKHNNYLLNHLAYQEARNRGFDEAILCRDGEVVEGSRSNLWIWREEQLLTPPISSGALPGVIRARILKKALKAGIEAREVRLNQQMVADAEGIFLSNAGLVFQSVTLFGKESYPVEERVLRGIRKVILSDG